MEVGSALLQQLKGSLGEPVRADLDLWSGPRVAIWRWVGVRLEVVQGLRRLIEGECLVPSGAPVVSGRLMERCDEAVQLAVGFERDLKFRQGEVARVVESGQQLAVQREDDALTLLGHVARRREIDEHGEGRRLLVDRVQQRPNLLRREL